MSISHPTLAASNWPQSSARNHIWSAESHSAATATAIAAAGKPLAANCGGRDSSALIHATRAPPPSLRACQPASSPGEWLWPAALNWSRRRLLWHHVS